ncbi:MAG: type II toxin-antitoxin system PemK/MazF family toxin, partial [Ruminococcus sp.]|nr:type II toxin-antitoxin system PemK/MazF family toxin [Ruminococcus sp.]
LYPEKQEIICKYYKDEPERKRYVLNTKKSAVSEEDKNIIIHSCILKKGMVVWVEFGYNIGCEFGGKHPALILKNCKDSVIVVPISSKAPTESTEKFNVQIDRVYNFPQKSRWTNILRIQPVSIQRIDFLNRFGSVSNSVLKDISDKISTNGIK